MFNTVYKTTNTKNGKIYQGVHVTSDLGDGYLGSGLRITRAIKKYGVESFSKEILFMAKSEPIAYWIERMLVDEDFVLRDDTYNLKVGGQGGWDHITPEHYEKRSLNKVWVQKAICNLVKGKETQKVLLGNPYYFEKVNQKQSESMKAFYSNGGKNGFKGSKHSSETKEKLKGHVRQQGEKNSQYGSIWIYNLEEKLNQKIKKEEFPEYEKLGWSKGRKMKF